MFIGRQKELNSLNQLYNSKQFEMAVIYGRRRIGKTTLIDEFIKDKANIFFTAEETTAELNLRSLSQAISSLDKIPAESYFEHFEQAFRSINQLAQDEKLVFIIDEYPYLAQSEPAVSSTLQKIIDHLYLKNPNLLLILCGSSMSFMEKQVLGYQSPLYGRKSAHYKLLPFSLEEAHQLLPGFEKADLLTLYGATGGIPLYLGRMNDQLTLKENLIQQFFERNAALAEEPRNLLNQEVRTPERYLAIIQAIASGRTTNSEIANATGLEVNSLSPYLNGLLELEIIEKIYPLGEEKNRKRGIFRIKDGLYQFYYKFVPKYKLLIERNQSEPLWAAIQDDLAIFTSKVFEEYCKNWLLSKNGQDIYPMLILQIGSWWGNHPLVREKQPEEIDILAWGANKDEMLIGECKWRTQDIGIDVVNKLEERSTFFNRPKKTLFLFSKSSFSEADKALAKSKNIKLIRFDEMF